MNHQEQIVFYENILAMCATQGWLNLCELLEESVDQFSIENIKTSEQLYKAQGQILAYTRVLQSKELVAGILDEIEQGTIANDDY